MADKELLRDMLDSLINDDTESASDACHAYVRDKMKEIVNPTAVNENAAHYAKMGYENEEEMMDDMDYDEKHMDGYNSMMDDMDDDEHEKLSSDMDGMERNDMCKHIKSLVSAYMAGHEDGEEREEY